MGQENKRFLDDLADRLVNMRLTAEGAVALFDQSQGKLDTLTVDLIGEVLYLL